jgi:hypothetical protein
MLDRRKELALLPLEDEAAGQLLTAVPEQSRGECWWFVCGDGTPVRGDAGAGVMLLAQVQLTRPLGRALGWLGLSPVIDAIDRLMARYRKRLGRLVPDGPAPRRYP